MKCPASRQTRQGPEVGQVSVQGAEVEVGKPYGHYRPRPALKGMSPLWWIGIAAFVGAMLAPFLVILVNSFVVSDPQGDGVHLGLAGWRGALAQPGIASAILNTVQLGLSAQAIALPVGVLVAWLIGRTDLPGRRGFEFLFWLSFFLPPLAVVQGWILLLDAQSGVLNDAFESLLGVRPFDLYSFGGIIFGHLVTTTISAKIMMLTPAFQNMDSRFEEAAYVAGDGPWRTLFRVTLPLLAPALVVTALVGLIRALESFEIELLLGAPHNIQVYSTKIYQLVRQDVPDYAAANVLGVVIILFLVGLALLAGRLERRRDDATISSHARRHLLPLGRWRWPAAILVALLAAVLTVVPLALLVTGSVMSLFGFFTIEDPWTLGHWRAVFTDPTFIDSLWNTLRLSCASAILTAALSFTVAYAIVHGPKVAARLLAATSWLPFTMPGVLFSLALFWLVIQVNRVVPVYGSTLVLAVAISLASVTVGVQLVRANLQQISRDMEEAAWLSGASRARAVRSIVLPLVTRSLAVVAVMAFVAAARNISHLSLLVASNNRPIAILQLEYLQEGRYEAAAVVGVIVVALAIGAALIARRLGRGVVNRMSH